MPSPASFGPLLLTPLLQTLRMHAITPQESSSAATNCRKNNSTQKLKTKVSRSSADNDGRQLMGDTEEPDAQHNQL